MNTVIPGPTLLICDSHMEKTRRTAEIIKQNRKALGLTQTQFSNLVSVKRATLASYETGRTDPPGSVLLRIIELGNGRMKYAA